MGEDSRRVGSDVCKSAAQPVKQHGRYDAAGPVDAVQRDGELLGCDCSRIFIFKRRG